MIKHTLLTSFAAGAMAASCSSEVFPRMSCGLSYTTEDECTSAGCCYDASPSEGLPSCYTPAVPGYSYEEVSGSNVKISGNLAVQGASGLFQAGGGLDESNLLFQAVQESTERTHLRITSAEKELWEVPESLLPRPGGMLSKDDQALTSISAGASSSGQFQFSVARDADGKTPIFSIGDNLIFQEQYIQFVVPVPSDVTATFGFGESTRDHQAISANATRTLWNTDVAAATFDVDLYGAHPFVLQLTSDGLASGYFVLSSNALQGSLQSSGKSDSAFGIQASGGIIDIYVFAGPTPSDVIRQYQEVVGFPAMVPYWSLGFHNCEWGYPNLDYVKEVVANYTAAAIPLETQWLDIDYVRVSYLMLPYCAVRLTAFVLLSHFNYRWTDTWISLLALKISPKKKFRRSSNLCTRMGSDLSPL